MCPCSVHLGVCRVGDGPGGGSRAEETPSGHPYQGRPAPGGSNGCSRHTGWLRASLSGDHLLEGLPPVAPSHSHVCAPRPAPQDIKMQLPCSETREKAAKNPPLRVQGRARSAGHTWASPAADRDGGLGAGFPSRRASRLLGRKVLHSYQLFQDSHKHIFGSALMNYLNAELLMPNT